MLLDDEEGEKLVVIFATSMLNALYALAALFCLEVGGTDTYL